MEELLPEESATGVQKGKMSDEKSAQLRQLMLIVAFFFAVCSLVPTAYGRVLLIWPVLSPIGAVIAVLSGWVALKLSFVKGDFILRATAGVTVLLWLPCWYDYGRLVLGDGRNPWQMLSDGFRMWVG